jgi:putative ABC transport system permease protein
MADQPEVEQVLLMREISGGQGGGQFITLPDGAQLYQKGGYFSENSIFDIFTIRMKEGSNHNALSEPSSIALSETLQKKLFPEGNAVGKKVVFGKRYPLTVTAVYLDYPLNATIRPTYLISLSTYETLAERRGFRDEWTYIDNDNFVLLKPGADPDRVDERIKGAFSHVRNFEKSTPYLHPLSKLHISPNSQSDMIIGLSIISLAGILVLVLSCVNYVNLSLSNSTRRACEIGIKKVVGFSKNAIAAQFITETMVLTLISMVLGVFLAQVASPVMSYILQNNVAYQIFENGRLLLIIFLVAILAGVLSG